MTSKGRAAVVFIGAVLVATGIGAVVYLREGDEALRPEVSTTSDAAPDGSAKNAKTKAPAKKKAAPRGGKTRVAGRATGGGGGGGAHPGSGHEKNGAAAPAPTHRHHAAPSGPSYESALDSNNHQLNIGAHAGADLTDAQLSGPMSDGTFVSECGAPDNMGVTVKVAIKMGKAVGVSVSTSPHSPDVAGCIDHHVRALSWPVSPKLDSFVTTY